jgi:UDP-glucose 4-epimerase
VRVLVTGGSGFIGRNLAAQLCGRHAVETPSRTELNLLDAAAVQAYLKARRFDVVVHAATEGVSRQRSGGPSLVENNCRMFFHLARNADTFGRMLFLSSGAVYDQAHWQRGMSEDYFDRYVPSDAYGFSKYVCARAAMAMDKVIELRVFGVFGPHEDWQVRFVSNACCRALWGLPIVIHRNVRFDYLDVEDLGLIVERFLDKELHYRQYNACRGTAFEIRALAEKVAAISGRHTPILIEREEPGNEYSGDNTRLMSELPAWRFREIDESLERLYRWYEARKNTIDPSLLG